MSYVKYDCDSGYKWNFPGDTSGTVTCVTCFGQHKLLLIDEQPQDKVASETQEEPSEHQRRRVDNLLLELVRRYPLKTVASKVSLVKRNLRVMDNVLCMEAFINSVLNYAGGQ